LDKNRGENKEESTIDDIIDNLKEELKQVQENSVNYYVFYYNQKKNPIAKKTTITKDIGSRFMTSLKDDVTSIGSSPVSNYDDNDSDLNDNVEVIRSSEVPFCTKVLNAIEETEDMLLPDQVDGITGLKFAVRFGQITAYGSLRKISSLKRNKKRISLTDSGMFKEVEEKVIFEIPDSFSAIHYKEHIFIISESAFESIFSYHERILETIRKNDSDNQRLFSDKDSFLKAVEGDSRKARKLYTAYKSNYIESLQVSDIVKYAKEYDLEIYTDSENKKIDLANSNSWHVVNAINEDFYTGRWSKSKYASRAKEKVS
jgi:hypothetical protein